MMELWILVVLIVGGVLWWLFQQDGEDSSESGEASWKWIESKGEWGVWVPFRIKVGEQVLVTADDGRRAVVTITNVLWKGKTDTCRCLHLCEVGEQIWEPTEDEREEAAHEESELTEKSGKLRYPGEI